MGAAYIVFAKLEFLPAIYVTLVPVVIMVGYAFVLGLARLFRLRDDQSGDNLYYMGFLFTLTSLAVSLHQFNSTRSADEIVQNFGIAIASTIAGIALRVLFNQLRRDPAEVEATARLELAEASRSVRRELESTVIEFSYFRRMAQQSVAEALEQVQDLLKEARQKFADELSQFAKDASKPLMEASNQSGETIQNISGRILEGFDSITDKLSEDGQRLSKSMVSVVTALEAMSAKLASMQTPEAVIEIKLQPMVQGLSRAINSFTAASDKHSQTIDANLRELQSITESLVNLADELRTRARIEPEPHGLRPWGPAPKDGQA